METQNNNSQLHYQTSTAQETQKEQSIIDNTRLKDYDLPIAGINSQVVELIGKMIRSAANAQVIETSKENIEQLPKKERGDRQTARKLNDEAIALIKQNKKLESLPLLESANQADPGDVEIANNLASIYIQTATNNDFSKAKELLVETLALRPDRIYAWYDFGRIFAMEGNSEAAKNSFIVAYHFSKKPEKTLELYSTGEGEVNQQVRDAKLSAYKYIFNQ